MIRLTSWRITAALALAAALGTTAAGRAQNATTGTLGGVVRDAQLGVLPGASIVAVHAPTGTRYEAFTRADGRFDLLNAQVGPYDLEITLSGFGTRALSGVVVSLGEATEVPVTLQLATVTETVNVTAEASSVFSPSRSGTTAGVESGVIETLPTLERSLQDFARTNPFFVKTNRNADPESFLSVAGRSGRYNNIRIDGAVNNIQIDGAVNNDLFGLAAQGTPGGQANTEPISLDAVSELQLVVAPYDVRQSGFSGGGINVITRGGSNRFSGTAYFYSRNQGLVGRGVDDVPIATFFDRQQGASAGGPLVRNRAFFFANVDLQRRETPVGYSLDGSSGVDFGRLAQGQRIVDVARTRYGYDIPGGFGEIIRGNPNDKIFVRSDLNLSPAHRLSVRHNHVGATADVGSQSNFRYRFTDNFYRFRSRTDSTVAQLNSTFGAAFNLARVSYQRIRDRRGPRTAPFPAGHHRPRGRGGHTVRHRAVLDRERARSGHHRDPQRPDLGARAAPDHHRHPQRALPVRQPVHPRQLRRLRVHEPGALRAGAGPVLQLQLLAHRRPAAGGRVPGPPARVLRRRPVAGPRQPHADLRHPPRRAGLPRHPDGEPARRDAVRARDRRRARDAELVAAHRLQLRPEPAVAEPPAGARGLRPVPRPHAVRLAVEPVLEHRERVSADPGVLRLGQPDSVLGRPRRPADRRRLGVDQRDQPRRPRLPLPAAPARQPRLRPRPRLLRPGGERRAALLEDRPRHRLPQPEPRRERRRARRAADALAPAPRLQQRHPAHEHRPGRQLDGGDQARQALRRQLVHERLVPLRRVAVRQRRRVEPGDVELALQLPGRRPERGAAGPVRLLARPPVQPVGLVPDSRGAGRRHPRRLLRRPAGRPYSYLDGSDSNRDGTRGNDLLYVPRGAADVIVTDGAFDDLMRFLSVGCDVTPGTIVPRNACRGPWTYTLDFHLGVDFPRGPSELELFIDIRNLINAFDARNGLAEFAFFQNLQPVRSSVDPATGRYVYSLNSPARPGFTGDRFARDDLRSRWQAQLGVRYSFGR